MRFDVLPFLEIFPFVCFKSIYKSAPPPSPLRKRNEGELWFPRPRVLYVHDYTHNEV